MQELRGKESIWVSTDQTTNISGQKVLGNYQIPLQEQFVVSHQEKCAVNHTVPECVFNEAKRTL
jgi:hypothetical protein